MKPTAMTMTDLIEQFVEDLEFDVLLGWADLFKVEHNEKHWLDDEWPDKEDELRVEVADSMGKIGK